LPTVSINFNGLNEYLADNNDLQSILELLSLNLLGCIINRRQPWYTSNSPYQLMLAVSTGQSLSLTLSRDIAAVY